LATKLKTHQITDPNTFNDLWDWYGRWKADFPTYQSRRDFIANLYQPIFDRLEGKLSVTTAPDEGLTGWERADREWEKIRSALINAQHEEDFQSIGHKCRELMITTGQAVFDAAKHPSPDGVPPSTTDAKRMIESYVATTLAGASNSELRKHVKTTFDLANAVQHRRTATRRDAAICVEATRTVINLIKILEGK
jgi:hypothetical protein